MNPVTERPALSVIVVRFAGGEAVESTLHALDTQSAHLALEVICMSGREHRVPESWRTRYASVRWIDAPAQSSPARLRTLGVLASTGVLVACTEDHCVPASDWCRRICDAHHVPQRVVGGAIDKGKPPVPARSGAGAWAAYLLDYSRYMPPLSGGPAEYLSDCNVSYARDALNVVAHVWREEFHETAVHGALVGRGVSLVLDPSILVSQERGVDLAAYLRERTHHGRIFATTRLNGASSAARLRWIAMSLLLPPVIVLRVLSRLRSKGRLRSVPLSAWPPLALAAVAWSLGEWLGYSTGRAR